MMTARDDDATTDAEQVLKMVCDAIHDAVKAAGSLGAPAGVMYAAMNAHGCSLEMFNKITGSLVNLGLLRRQGDLFFTANEWSR